MYTEGKLGETEAARKRSVLKNKEGPGVRGGEMQNSSEARGDSALEGICTSLLKKESERASKLAISSITSTWGALKILMPRHTPNYINGSIWGVACRN